MAGFGCWAARPFKVNSWRRKKLSAKASGVSAPYYNTPPPYVIGFVVEDQSGYAVSSLTMSPGDSKLAGAYLVYSDGSEALVFTDVSSGNESVATATQGGLPAWTT